MLPLRELGGAGMDSSRFEETFQRHLGPVFFRAGREVQSFLA
jgi:hypothetical protein